MDCLFCKIVAGEIPSEKIFENDKVFGFKDISPMAPIHVLFVHKEHTANISELSETQSGQLQDVFKGITQWAQEQNLDEGGFRIVTNQGVDAGQTVFHTHFHVLAGKKLGRFG